MAMRLTCLAMIVAGVAASGVAGARRPAVPAAGQARYLASDALDPALLLPPPPLPGSAEERREVAAVRAIVAATSADEAARVKLDDRDESPDIFDQAIAPRFSLRRLPKTWALLGRVAREADAAASRAKRHFDRTRPWGVDPAIVACDAGPGKRPVFSYPSGHAMLGYSVGLVLARMLPERAPSILSRARDYADERVECGAHYPSDIEASHVLASILVGRLDTVAAFRADIDAATIELRAALPPL